MKKRLLIFMALLVTIVTGAWAQTTKTIYVYPKAWDMTGCKIALYAWSPSSMFDDLQKSTTYPECYTIEVDKDLETCILVQLPESASNDWSNKISQTFDINVEDFEDNILIVVKEQNNGNNLTEVTTIDHLNEYLTPAIPATDYYLIGNLKGLDITENSPKFVANPNVAGEYILQGIVLQENEEIKVRSSEDEWFNNGGEYYKINTTGIYDIHFNPEGNSNWDYWYMYAEYKGKPSKYIAVVYCEAFGDEGLSRNREFYFDESGRLTYDFPAASYVFIRNDDTGVQYYTDGWTDFANPVTLVNESSLLNPGNFDKFYVPSGEHTLYLQDNGDDTFTIVYDNDIRTKTVYVFPKCVSMTGEQMALWSWPFDGEGKWTEGVPDNTYTGCYRFEIPIAHDNCIACVIAETDPIAWDRVEARSTDLSLPNETDGVLIVFPTFTGETLPILPTEITTIDHLDDYITPTPTTHDPEVAVYCDSYTWERNGQTYTASGTYTYEAKDGEGNVTDIYTLELTIHNSTTEERYDYAAVGSRYTKEPFDFVVEAGQDTYYYTTSNEVGCDHVITLHLTLLDDEVMDAVWNEYAYNGTVGSIYSPECTTFKVWNPLCKSVTLNLYATGSDIETGAQKLGTYDMEKLMDGDQWTGVWTCTVEGDFKNTYYTYTIDGTEVSDPWAVTAGKDNQRSMVCDADATDPENWNSDSHVFYEPGNAVTYIHVPEFSADPMYGVSEANRGKYLALTENQTTYGNVGEVPTCMSALKEDGTKAVVIDVAAPLMMPDQYVSNPYDGNCQVNEFKQMAQAVHNTFGMSLFVRFDFSTIPPYNLTYNPQPDRYIYETCLYWVNEYHVDGIVLAADIDADTKAAIREALDAIDTRIILATDSEIEAMQVSDGIREIDKSPTTAVSYYTVDGRTIQGKPTKKGIYVVKGKKVMK